MPAKITVCYRDKPAVESFLYEESGYRIGRAQECELLLNHPTVSRHHAKVNHSNKIWQLFDERSRNGTKVNGIAITHSTLHEDALISVGQLDCLFETKTTEQLHALTQHNEWRLANCANQTTNINQNLRDHIYSQLQNIILLTGTQRGTVLLGDSLDSLQVCLSIGLQTTDFKLSQFEGSIGAISQCLDNGKQVIAMNVSHEQLLKSRQSIELKQISALACIPLFYQDNVIGVIYTDSKMSDKILTELDIEILKGMTQQLEATVQAVMLQQSIDALQSSLQANQHGQLNQQDHHLLKLCS